MADIHKCKKLATEKTSQYASRFNAAVASHVNQTSNLMDAGSRQFAILRIRNAKLSPDTMNAILFQLNALNKMETRSDTLDLFIDEINHILRSDHLANTCLPSTIDKLNVAKQSATNVKEGIISMFTVEDAFSCLSQVVDDPVKTVPAMIGKGNSQVVERKEDQYKRVKAESRCRACSVLGH